MSSQHQSPSSSSSSSSYYHSYMKTPGAPRMKNIPLPPVENDGYYFSPNSNPQRLPPPASYYHSHSAPGAPYMKTIPLPSLKDDNYHHRSVDSTPQRLPTPPPTHAHTDSKYQQQHQQAGSKSYYTSSRK